MEAFFQLGAPVVLAGLGFTAFFALHLYIWRTPLRRGLAYPLIFSLLALGGLLGPALWRLLGFGPWTPHAAPAAAAYLLLAMLYLHFYSGLVRSLSVRILGELAAAEDRRLELSELDRRYPLSEILDRRLDALESAGWIEKVDGGYRNRPRGRRWATLLEKIARLYRQDVTG